MLIVKPVIEIIILLNLLFNMAIGTCFQGILGSGGGNSILSDFDGTYHYTGVAAQGTETFEALWTITRMLVDVNTNVTTDTATNAVWDNRLTETYL